MSANLSQKRAACTHVATQKSAVFLLPPETTKWIHKGYMFREGQSCDILENGISHVLTIY